MKKAILMIILLLSSTLFADWENEQKLTASDGAAYDYFGNSISIDGEYAVIGAWKEGASSSMTGSAYIFYNNGSSWSEQLKLTVSDGGVEDFFGYSVSISGDYAVIGAYGDDDNGTNSGSAYIFIRSGTSWTEQVKITASDGVSGDRFGCSVSISGDYAIVGAWGDDNSGIDRGSAYIFYRSGTNWIEQAKLTAAIGMDDDLFGYSVSISGDYAIVGSHYGDDNESESGSAYIFHRSGTSWTEQAKLTTPDGAAYDWFGYTVSIESDYAVIGAHWDDDNGTNSGSVYIFHRSGTSWTEQTKLTADDGSVDDEFGRSVAIDGNYVAVGACHDDENGTDRGSAYIFHRSGTSWTQQAKITASDGADFDYFGCPVSISGNYALISAYYNDENGIDSGSAYVYFNDGVSIEENTYVPDSTIFLENYPNPFNPETTISYNLSNEQNQQVELEIYNLKGQKVKDLSPSLHSLSSRAESRDEVRGESRYSVVWNGTDDNNQPISSGIYFYKLRTDNLEETKKMILMK